MFVEIAKNETLVGIGILVGFLCGIPVAWGAITRISIFWTKHHYSKWNIYKDYQFRIELSALRAVESHTYFASIMWVKLVRSFILMIYYFVLREIYKTFREIAAQTGYFDQSINSLIQIVFFVYFIVVGVIIVASLYEMTIIAKTVKRQHSDGLDGD